MLYWFSTPTFIGISTLISFLVSIGSLIRTTESTFIPLIKKLPIISKICASSNSTIPNKTFNDFIIDDCIMEKVNYVITTLKHSEEFEDIGYNLCNSIIFYGPPGTGKTSIAEAMAYELGYNFIKTNGAELISCYVGETAKNIRAKFEEARSLKPCILFLDEIDSIGGARNGTEDANHRGSASSINQLLTEIEDKEKNSGILIIAATNRKNVLDPALLRRFDYHFNLDLPSLETRKKLFKFYLNRLENNVDDNTIFYCSQLTSGSSCSDIAKIVNNSLLLAISKKRIVVQNNELERSTIEHTMGLNKSENYTKEELEHTIIHEIGHAIIAWYLNYRKVFCISVEPRENSGGVTIALKRPNVLISKEFLYSNIMWGLGGKTAEKLFLNLVSVGPVYDLEDATKTAKLMLEKFGMMDTIVIKDSNDENKHTMKKIDMMLKICFEYNEIILSKYKDAMQKFIEYFEKNKIMYKEDFESIMNEYGRFDLSYELEKLKEKYAEEIKIKLNGDFELGFNPKIYIPDETPIVNPDENAQTDPSDQNEDENSDKNVPDNSDDSNIDIKESSNETGYEKTEDIKVIPSDQNEDDNSDDSNIDTKESPNETSNEKTEDIKVIPSDQNEDNNSDNSNIDTKELPNETSNEKSKDNPENVEDDTLNIADEAS